LPSVFRPGTALMGWAWTTRRAHCPSSTLETGRPVDPGAFHGHMGAPALLEPIRQGQQIGRHRPQGPHLLHGLRPLGPEETAGDHSFFVHVEATAARIHHVPQAPPEVSTPPGMPVACRISPACFLDEERQTVVPPSIQVLLLAG
jgi:hypothetical protein